MSKLSNEDVAVISSGNTMAWSTRSVPVTTRRPSNQIVFFTFNFNGTESTSPNRAFVPPSIENTSSGVVVVPFHADLDPLKPYFVPADLRIASPYLGQNSFLIPVIAKIAEKIRKELDTNARFSMATDEDNGWITLNIVSTVKQGLDACLNFQDYLLTYLIRHHKRSFELLNVVILPDEI